MGAALRESALRWAIRRARTGIALKAALDVRVTRVCQRCCSAPAVLENRFAVRDQWSRKDRRLVASRHFANERLEIGQSARRMAGAAVDAAGTAIKARSGHVASVVARRTPTCDQAGGIEFDGYPLSSRAAPASRGGRVPDDLFDSTRIVHATRTSAWPRDRAVTPGASAGPALDARHAGTPGREKPRIAVSGLNPPPGNPPVRSEEIEIIAPAIEAAAPRGHPADGPYGADIMFHRAGYDAFLVMFHDQGHIAAS